MPVTSTPSSSVSNNRYWMLALLILIYAMSLLDRSVIGVLLDSIKADMHVSDTIMGIVTGLGFAVLYGIAGIPLAQWADHANRRNIISGGLVVFSLATALSGFAQNIWHLLTGRLLLALGEASQLSPSVSILADLFGKRTRARVMSIFATGPGIGILFGLSLAGYLNEHHGWRIALMAIGIPGLILAALLRFTVAEPARGKSDAPSADVSGKSFRQTMRFLLLQRSYWLMLCASALMAWPLFGTTAWGPAFMGRVHGLGSADIGLYFGAVYGVLGLCGTLTSGFVADYLGRRHESRKLLFPAITALLTGPAYLLFLLADSVWLALVGLGLIGFLTSGLLGPIWAIMQSVTKIRMRSTAAALFQLMTNLIGMGVGPALIGYLNDRFAPRYGDISIRYSMLVLAAAALISGIALLAASLFVSRDAARTAGAD